MGTGLPHSILVWAQDCPGVFQKTLEARRYTETHSRTRRPDCPENSVSAVLHSTALTYSPPGFPPSNLASNAKEMGKIKLFPTTEYSSKQPSDPVVPLVPCTGIFLGPSKSGKSVALISLILEQSRGVFERIYIFSPSVNIDDGWIPVKKYIEGDMGVNTEREQTYWDEWDEAALRRIIQQQRKITEASKKLEMKKLYQVLVVIDDFADTPAQASRRSIHQGPAHADQHLGELAEAEAHQRSRAGEHAIPLLLEAAQPARAGRRY